MISNRFKQYDDRLSTVETSTAATRKIPATLPNLADMDIDASCDSEKDLADRLRHKTRKADTDFRHIITKPSNQD